MIYKKPRQQVNAELNFLNSFLASDFFEKINEDEQYEISLIQEPFTGFGYTDLVCIIWDKIIKEKWLSKRNQLVITDIKILHHLFNTKIKKKLDDIVLDLGFNTKEVQKAIDKLFNADLVYINYKNEVTIKPIDEIFFIKDIITFEAKLRDWKRALEQSSNNIYFSSESYVLFPENIITDNLIEAYKKTTVGIITFANTYSIVKNPNKHSIPASLNSWFFNEYIGRMYG